MEDAIRMCMQRGYQIVFDISGIRVWHVTSMPAPMVYSGNSFNDMFNSMNAHWPTTLEAR